MENTENTCPCCGRHCPMTDLHCGRGREHFGIADEENTEDRREHGEGREGRCRHDEERSENTSENN